MGGRSLVERMVLGPGVGLLGCVTPGAARKGGVPVNGNDLSGSAGTVAGHVHLGIERNLEQARRPDQPSILPT
jgi:hypothetical protein